MKARLELDLDAISDPQQRTLLTEWRDIDWLQPGTSANAAEAARAFGEYQSRAHGYAPDLFAPRVAITARISSWTELAALCDAVRGPGVTWDWKHSGLKRLAHQHNEAHGWSLDGSAPAPFIIHVGPQTFWSLHTSVDLRDVPAQAREAANWCLSYTPIDLVHALEWQLAEPAARLDDNPFAPLLRCYATGFLPFMLDRDTVTLWSLAP